MYIKCVLKLFGSEHFLGCASCVCKDVPTKDVQETESVHLCLVNPIQCFSASVGIHSWIKNSLF